MMRTILPVFVNADMPDAWIWPVMPAARRRCTSCSVRFIGGALGASDPKKGPPLRGRGGMGTESTVSGAVLGVQRAKMTSPERRTAGFPRVKMGTAGFTAWRIKDGTKGTKKATTAQ